ncbi:MAG: Type IV pilus inner membrane protein PilC [Candidatus Uhrbacteria bacterium GW2011_GWE2_45_35]|uniref:Type IV pilus inner membrane protein PilC n=2 Tax=Candidatus Uhriibacteriota TaxID=1752732 RepID=A0A0G1J955_9BACT|nr:MAG: Type IV pilus inner membrane protein PilC [Candidatus Uhrbacteria bacterium GW2011_GWF2_44_350]KKU08907.1 MAG: Type IV pilus inner membrane protein PilC [Candidatus Uhrbacteria bacterium GW2011_GWE2_45_35]HBR80960.1 hypothetical protein [Candidatus Uhrbacteria bacterium]HCU31909.1 hypothetical protein [Candidatus Uhrbacteria bacterium]
MNLKTLFKNQPRLKHVELLLFTKYLAVLLRSGLPLDESLEILNKQTKKKKTPLCLILTSLVDHIRTGKTFADGLSEFPKTFSPVYVNLIRAGEGSGTLQDNLDQLVKQLEREHALTEKIRGAMMYPSVIMLAGLAIASVIVVFILPQITGLFSSLRVEIPLSTRLIFWLSDTIRFKWPWLLGGGLILGVVINIFYRFKKTKPFFHAFFLVIPILGNLIKKINLARSFRLLGTLLRSGVPISEAFDVTISVVRNLRYRDMFEEMRTGISHGGTVAAVLEKHTSLVPPIALRLVNVGEETGTLSDMLLYLAVFYEDEIESQTKNLTSLIEPVMIIFIGLAVGWLAISILMPIYKVVGSV